jgi:hypothetical protein
MRTIPAKMTLVVLKKKEAKKNKKQQLQPTSTTTTTTDVLKEVAAIKAQLLVLVSRLDRIEQEVMIEH